MQTISFTELLKLAEKLKSQSAPAFRETYRIHTPWGAEDNEHGMVEFMLLADLADRQGWPIEKL